MIWLYFASIVILIITAVIMYIYDKDDFLDTDLATIIVSIFFAIFPIVNTIMVLFAIWMLMDEAKDRLKQLTLREFLNKFKNEDSKKK